MKIDQSSLEFEPDSRLYGAPLGHLFVVADGMGGHQAGNRASELAINYFVGGILNSRRWMTHPLNDSEQKFVNVLKELLCASNHAIVVESNSQASYRGMGTTLTMAYVDWPNMWIVHAGDTRCYLLRNEVLQQLTRDHTLAEQMTSQGLLQADQSDRSPWANVLWNALGAGSSEVVADTYQVDLSIGDRILLCSDGLNKHVDDRELQSLLSRNAAPIATCEAMIQMANELGGSDNITAIVADILEPSSSQLSTYVAKPTTDESLIHRFIDYTSSPDESTVDRPDQPKPRTTLDF